MEQLRTMACLETKTATLLQIEPGEVVKGIEIASDSVAGHWQVYMRVRAFFFTCAYVCAADPSMFDLQTANAASEKVLNFLQHTYSGRPPPVSFFVLAWTQTCHLLSEALRLRKSTLKSIVLDGSLWESHWTSYIPTQTGSGGSRGQVDTSPDILAEIRAAKRVADSAHSPWDNYTQPTTKRARGKGKGSFGKGQGNSWTSNGNVGKKKRRRHGKGSK